MSLSKYSIRIFVMPFLLDTNLATAFHLYVYLLFSDNSMFFSKWFQISYIVLHIRTKTMLLIAPLLCEISCISRACYVLLHAASCYDNVGICVNSFPLFPFFLFKKFLLLFNYSFIPFLPIPPPPPCFLFLNPALFIDSGIPRVIVWTMFPLP